jgi:hypothetical protein
MQPALQTYLQAHAASNRELQAGLQNVASAKVSVAASNDAQTRQNAEAVAQGVADVLGTVLVLGAAFAEGYADAEAAKASAYQPPQRINCTSNRVGTYIHTNCY